MVALSSVLFHWLIVFRSFVNVPTLDQQPPVHVAWEKVYPIVDNPCGRGSWERSLTMPQYLPPPPDTTTSSTRPLPPGWIEEIDSASGQPYFVDTLSLNPQPTWDDPRLNPALYPTHEPSLQFHQSTANSTSRPQIPSVTKPAVLPAIKVYPDYPQPRASGGAAILTAAGAAVAAGMVCRRVGSNRE